MSFMVETEPDYSKVTCLSCAGEKFAQLMTEHYKDWSWELKGLCK